jgi:hypothetical protein
MKRWIARAAALYPRNWRKEFGEEFDALLEDVEPGWHVFANVLGGAVRMQISSGSNWLKVIAATAVVGAIVAWGVSLTVAPRYESSAVMSVTPQSDPARPPAPEGALRQRAAAHIAEVETEILSRTSLWWIIRDPSLDLYKEERERLPLEEVIGQMRGNIRIQAHPSSAGGRAPIVFSVSFTYPDQAKAQAVVRSLVKRFAEANLVSNRERTTRYQNFWQDMSAGSLAKAVPPPPVGDTVAVLDPASRPMESERQNRITFLAWGLGAGLLLGMLAVLAMRWPRGVSRLGGFAAVGCVAAWSASFLIPNRYTSTAVMRIAPAEITEDPLATAPAATPAAEFLHHMEPQILSFQRLSTIIQDPRLDLYPPERARKSMEEVVRNMLARDLSIAVVSPAFSATGTVSAFSISFSYFDPRKAQQLVQALITLFQDIAVQDTAG